MQLDDVLLKSFAKITNDEQRRTDDSVKGTVVVQDNVSYVQLDGSEELTPVDTTAGMKNGDRVLVAIKNHKATILGNFTDPSATVGTVNTLTELTNTINQYANAALDQLGVVQDVVGVLNWASSHGSFALTSDTEIQNGKVYFAFDGTDYTPVVTPDASQLSNYYELTVTEAMQSYIMAHLAVTNRGLWVLPSGINTGSVTPASGETIDDARARLGSNYKVLLSNSEMIVYDGNGIEIALYGASARVGKINEYNTEITSSGFNVKNNGAVLASFGSDVTIGQTNSYNTYISSSEFRIRNNGTTLTRFTGNTIYFYDGVGNASTNVLASFGSSGSVIGSTSDLNIRITAGAVQFRSGTTTVGKISVDDVPTGTVGMFFNLGKNNYISSYYEASGNSNQIWISASRYQSGSNETSDIFLDSYGGIYLMASHNIISLQTGDYIDLSATVYSTSNIYAGGTVYTSGKVAIDDGTAGIALGAGNMRLASASDPKIYFYRNSGTSPSSYLIADGNNLLTASGSFAVGSVQSYTPTWSITPDNQTPVRYQCIVSAGICSFWYMGAAVAHSANTTLCTLPTGARPTAQVMAPFVKMSGNVVGCISITTAGVVSINQISSTTSTGRIYFNVSFPVV